VRVQQRRGALAQLVIAGAHLIQVGIPLLRLMPLDGGEEDVPELLEVGAHRRAILVLLFISSCEK
jgi:hypothetical protein